MKPKSETKDTSKVSQTKDKAALDLRITELRKLNVTSTLRARDDKQKGTAVEYPKAG